jgi:hypothetical protein
MRRGQMALAITHGDWNYLRRLSAIASRQHILDLRRAKIAYPEQVPLRESNPKFVVPLE